MPSTKTEISRIAVIGAGVAGLMAARRLSTKFRVDVFETLNEAGGRLKAQSGTVLWRDQSLLDDELNSFGKHSAAQFFTLRSEKIRDALIQMDLLGGLDVWEPDLWVYGPDGVWRSSPWQEPHFLPIGKKSDLSKDIYDGKIEFATRIDTVEQVDGHWFLQGSSGVGDRFDAVVFAVPPSNLKRLKFSPPRLPTIQATIGLLIRCEEPIKVPQGDQNDSTIDAAFIQKGSLDWICRLQSRVDSFQDHSYILHWTPQLSSVPDCKGAIQIASKAFEKMGIQSRFFPLALFYWPDAKVTESAGALSFWDSEKKLGYCGDWCPGARVEGALSSGFDLADKILLSL